ncbi:MAG: hypothetical protein HQL45_15180 [Alphaproteobacteria bacterium]|nr:hypothetical protein [Alphaproteobacteria bacterium]
MTQATFTFRVDEALKSAFAKAAKAEDRTAAQYLRSLMREAVQNQKDHRTHERWFRAEVEKSLLEADDAKVERLAHDDVRGDWRRKRSELVKRARNSKA